MSLPPDKATAPGGKGPGRRRVPFEQWRKVMLLGAFVLLGNAILVAWLEPDPPRALSLVMAFLGYGLLAAGFGIRMRSMKAARAAAEEKRASGAEEGDS